jgi:hypothetical protein
VRRSTHVPEQLVWPLGHAHAPPKHCVPPVHLVPQVPQLAGSDLVSVQPMLHEVRPVVHAAVHVLAEQSGVVPLHLVPHAPQLSGSLVVSTQEPEHATVGLLHEGLPPVPVVVDAPPVPVVDAPPVPLVDAPPVPVVDAPPVPLVDAPLVLVLLLLPLSVKPPVALLLPQPAANPVAPAKSDAPSSQDVRDR